MQRECITPLHFWQPRKLSSLTLLCGLFELQLQWSYGITKGGSSGSPLINSATGAVLGVLTGKAMLC